MPELPEVETIRRTLKPLILNHKIESIEVFYEKVIDGNVNGFIQTLTNQTFLDIDRVGKYLVFKLEQEAFISHLRMEGKYFVVKKEEEIHKHCHVIFHLDHGYDLRYEDTRKFGRMQLVSLDHYKEEKPLNKLGKELFDIDPKALYEKLKTIKRPIKEVLLDQTIILGIGNIYANEICFKMGIHPNAPANHLTLKRTKELVEDACLILNEAIKQGGTTIHTFSANGIDGLFQVRLNVHGKQGQPCPICHRPIEKIKIGGRGTYYCKHCQRKTH